MNEWISQIRSVMTAVRSGGAGGGGEGTSSTRVTNPTVKSPPTTPVKKRPAPAKPIDSAIAVVASVANNTLISSTTTSTTTTVATGVPKTFLFSFFFLLCPSFYSLYTPPTRHRPTVLKCKQTFLRYDTVRCIVYQPPPQPLTRCATTVSRCVAL